MDREYLWIKACRVHIVCPERGRELRTVFEVRGLRSDDFTDDVLWRRIVRPSWLERLRLCQPYPVRCERMEARALTVTENIHRIEIGAT